jgi:hypothetical protein
VLLQEDYDRLNNALTEMEFKNSISDTKDSTIIKTTKANDTEFEDLRNRTDESTNSTSLE